MPYKDKDRQREADRERQRRYRAWKASAGVTSQGVTSKSVTKPKGMTEIPEPYVMPERTRVALERGPARPPLTKEQVQQAYDNLPDRDTSLPRANRQPLTKEQQVSKLGFNT